MMIKLHLHQNPSPPPNPKHSPPDPHQAGHKDPADQNHPHHPAGQDSHSQSKMMVLMLTKLRTAIAFVPVLTEKPQQQVVRKGILEFIRD